MDWGAVALGFDRGEPMDGTDEDALPAHFKCNTLARAKAAPISLVDGADAANNLLNHLWQQAAAEWRNRY